MPNPNPQVLTDAYIAVYGGSLSGTTVLSNWGNKIALTDEADQTEVTGFSSSGYRSYIQGLKKAEIAASFFQDFGANAIDQTLQPLYASGGTFTVEVRPTEQAVSATNPSYKMVARLYAWSPLNGAVGDASGVDVTFENAGTAGLVRGTT
jgi:hypothetical protein